MLKITNDGWLNPVWHIVAWCFMVTLGVKGLIFQ